MKKEKRLKPDEAAHLGLPAKPNEANGRSPRYHLSEEQLEKLDIFRAGKLLSVKGTSTLRDGEGNIVLEWTKTSYDKAQNIKAFQSVIDSLKDHIEPRTLIEFVPECNNELCTQYTITDFHLGMMAWGEESGADWDTKIAENMLVSFFEQAIQSAPNSKQAILCQLGDFLHWDGLEAVTPTSKHVLDADTRFTKLVRVAIKVLRWVVDTLLLKHENVHIVMAEGNHDIASSVWLRESFSVFYSQNPRVTIDLSPDPYYAFTWGNVALFYHHGHKRNMKQIQPVFITKFKSIFGSSKYCYAHVGHRHFEREDTGLMVIEQHPTLSAKDSYASRGGYNSIRAAKVHTYHKEKGLKMVTIINADEL